MSGLVKRKYESELEEIKQKIYREIKQMLVVLPPKFTLKDIVSYYKIYYPLEYFLWDDMNKTYIQKNLFLRSKKKKLRYKEYSSFSTFLLDVPGINCLLVKSKSGELSVATSEETQQFIIKRQTKIECRKQKIENYRKSLFNGDTPFEIDPLCLETLIKEYHKANTENKFRIVDYLMKYTGDITIQFFKKLNDCENNTEIRLKTFKHLQSLGYYVKLRSTPKKSDKLYGTASAYVDDETFDDLFLLINNSNSFERKKQFHFFISHNKNDRIFASELKEILNKKGYDCYFCWISDDKEGISEHLGEILELRIKQSRAVIKIDSENHRNSDWCQYEIEKSIENHKQVYTYVTGEDINQFVNETIRRFRAKQ